MNPKPKLKIAVADRLEELADQYATLLTTGREDEDRAVLDAIADLAAQVATLTTSVKRLAKEMNQSLQADAEIKAGQAIILTAIQAIASAK